MKTARECHAMWSIRSTACTRRRWIRVIVVPLYVICALGSAEVPLPPDTRIAAPAEGVAKGLAAFAGRWDGNWGGSLESIVVVEEIDVHRAKLIYAWGDAPARGIVGGYARIEGTVVPEQGPEITFAMPAKMAMRMNEDLASFEITRVSGNQVLNATFRKIASAQQQPTTTAPAVTAPPIELRELPKKLKGRWVWGTIGNRGNEVTVSDLTINSDGTFNAKMTAHYAGAVTMDFTACDFVHDVPVRGTIWGSSISLNEIGGSCKRRWTYKRGKQHFLEYEDTSRKLWRYLDPE